MGITTLNDQEPKKFLGFYNKSIAYVAIGFVILMSLMAVVSIFYNSNTGFWFDKPYLDEGYYIWHPHENDTCEELQSKLDLFHPDGTNPVRFELLKAMFEQRCEVILRR